MHVTLVDVVLWRGAASLCRLLAVAPASQVACVEVIGGRGSDDALMLKDLAFCEREIVGPNTDPVYGDATYVLMVGSICIIVEVCGWLEG